MTTYYTRDMVDDAVREELGPGVEDLLPTMDPIFSKIMSSSENVTGTGIGRDWKVKHTFCVSVGGAFKYVNSRGGAIAGGRQAPIMSYTSSTPRAFQSVDEVTAPAVELRELQLVQGMGNFYLPIQVMQMDTLDASLMNYVLKNVKMTAMNVAGVKAMGMYKTYDASGNPRVALVDGTSSTYTWGTSGHAYDAASSTAVGDSADNYENRVEVAIDTGRINLFRPGMAVDVYASDTSGSSNKLNSKDIIVRSVDYLNGFLVLETIANDSDSGWTDGLSDNDVIVPRDVVASGSYLGPSGLEDWLVDSGSVYGMSTLTYPQLKSTVQAVSGHLTETVLNRYVGWTMEQYRGLVDLDTIITTGGVVRDYLDQHTDLGVFQRQGTTLNIQGGWADIGYSYQGKKFNWLISTYCAPGRLYCIQLGGGNLKRYKPPRISSAGSNSAFDGDIQFFAQIAGSNSIYKPAHNSSGNTTDFVEAPFFCFEETVPDSIQGVKLTGLEELNG